MDAFYASVEERDRPELRGKPLIVGGLDGRGVVAAASYAVRRYGVRSAMPMHEAMRRCPDAVCVRPRMARYREVSANVFEIFREHTPLVEGLSLDEAFLDVSASLRLFGSGESMAAEIRRKIGERTGLTASVGIAPNKLLAKIASDLNKPDGMCRIDAANLRAVLDPLPIDKLYGVGPKSLPAAHAAGIRTFADLRHANDAAVWRAFGRRGRVMRERANGVDERPVEPLREEKSISAEETFTRDIGDWPALEVQMLRLTEQATARLRAHAQSAGCVVLKIRRSDFKTYSRQSGLGSPTQDTAAVATRARELLKQWWSQHPGVAVRLLGVGLAELTAAPQRDLFAAAPTKDSRLDATVDGIRGRFGAGLITRASLLPRD